MTTHQTTETNYFFMIMSNLANAKAAADAEAIADCISDLEMIGLHSDRPVIAHRARNEVERATVLLGELHVQRGFCAVASEMVLTSAANLN